ncbi:zinc finger protein 391-like isoform X2 [Periplaneta americana]|uniref:zinc finger protein 391-like isoform X2 n=1 Tax=Periplaneta americana TaxID=6978 RepID=UPI0037E98050
MANEFCRLCAKQKTGIGIYEEEGLTLNLCSKIAKCLQIQIQPDDLLPKMVCLECCFKLEQSLEFFEASSRAQSLLLLNAEVQREGYVDGLSQQQHLPDSKDSVPCSSFSNSNILELTQPPQLKLNQQRKKDVISEQRKERKRNVVHCKTKRKSFEVFKVNKSKGTSKQFQLVTKQGDTLQRVRLDECYSWQCTDCPVVLTSLLELKDHHLKLHGQAVRYQCIECAKVYAVYRKFTRHVRLHRNYGKYSCEECRKSFSSKQAMENHKVLHSGARPYVCAECGKTFRQIGSLYTHRRVHQTDQNGFSCCDCGKLLQTQQSLDLHKKSHSGARDYTCDICGKSFVVKQGLAYHMMSHSGERPHCCELCGKRLNELNCRMMAKKWKMTTLRISYTGKSIICYHHVDCCIEEFENMDSENVQEWFCWMHVTISSKE